VTVFFLQTISQDREGLRTSNSVQRWHLVRGWCARLDLKKVFLFVVKLAFNDLLLAFFCKTPIFPPRHSHSGVTYRQKQRSTEDLVTTIILLVEYDYLRTLVDYICSISCSNQVWGEGVMIIYAFTIRESTNTAHLTNIKLARRTKLILILGWRKINQKHNSRLRT